MTYVGIDTQGARELGEALQAAADRADGVRREVTVALGLADLASDVPARIGVVGDGFASLGAGVLDKAELAERFLADPEGTSASLAAPEAELGAVLSGLLGLAGPTGLRGLLTGLPASGADPDLDAALARLDPVLLPGLLAGERPELTAQQLADLRLLALRLGIAHAGPPAAAGDPEQPTGGGFFAAVRRRTRSDTEVFWNDFWADGRTAEEVLADPEQLLEWVAGTFELDRRLAAATELPGLGDVVASVDFATTGTAGKDPEELAALVAGVEQEFAAIAEWLPAFLVGQDQTGPDPTQLAQALAFAARVGWPDPGTGAASEPQRFESAVAFLRANRALQSALLPTGFEGITDPLTFFNEAGIGFTLDLGRRSGAIDDAYLGNLAAVVDQQLAGSGVDLSGPEPVELTEPLQAQLFALVAGQLPGSLVESPAIQSQFVAALGYLRQATSGPELRQRIIEVVAAFRTLAVAGAPALTERQLVSVVGEKALRVLGRGRLRLRSQDRVRKNPEFLLVARQWGVPGSHKETIGKYKFRWGFNDLGELTQLKRKKKSFWSRAWDTIKSIGNAIWESWKDNPFKAIFQVGKLALGALAFAVPGLQGLGAAALAVNLAGAAVHAIEGNWLAAIGSGLSAFTGGVSDLVGVEQAAFVKDLLHADTLNILTNAKRAFDIGTSAFQALQADSLLGAITGGLGAVGTALHSGGGLLGSLGFVDADLAGQLARIGTSVRDAARLVTPAAGLVQALENGDALTAFANGLSVAAAGAGALLNPKGAFTDPSIVAGTVFEFERETQQAIASIARGTGVAASVTAAIDAANRGDAFLAGSFLARAVQVLNRPQTTVTGNRALVAQRIAELGRVLQAVYRSRNPNAASAAAPVVVQGLNGVLSALNTPLIPPLPVRNPARQAAELRAEQRAQQPAGVAAERPRVVAPGVVFAPSDPRLAPQPPTPQTLESLLRNPFLAPLLPELGAPDSGPAPNSGPSPNSSLAPITDPAGEAGTEEVTVFGGTNLSGQGPLTLAQADSSGGGQGPTVRFPDGQTIQARPGGEYFAPPGSTITLPNGVEIEALDPGLFGLPDGTRIHIDEVPTSSLDSDDLFGLPGFGQDPVLVEEFQTGLLAATGPDPAVAFPPLPVPSPLRPPAMPIPPFTDLDTGELTVAATLDRLALVESRFSGGELGLGSVVGQKVAQSPGKGRLKAGDATEEALFIQLDELGGGRSVNAELLTGEQLGYGVLKLGVYKEDYASGSTTWQQSPASVAAGSLPDWSRPETLRVGDRVVVDAYDPAIDDSRMTGKGYGFTGTSERDQVGATIAVERTTDGYRILVGERTLQQKAGDVGFLVGTHALADTVEWKGIALDVGPLDSPGNRELYASALRAAREGRELPIPPGTSYTRIHETSVVQNKYTQSWDTSLGGLLELAQGKFGLERDLHHTIVHSKVTEQRIRTDPGSASGEVALGPATTTSRYLRAASDTGDLLGDRDALSVTLTGTGGGEDMVTVTTKDAVYTFDSSELTSRARVLAENGDPLAANPVVQQLTRGVSAYDAVRSTATFVGVSNQEVLEAFQALTEPAIPPLPVLRGVLPEPAAWVPAADLWTRHAGPAPGADAWDDIGSFDVLGGDSEPAFDGLSIYEGGSDLLPFDLAAEDPWYGYEAPDGPALLDAPSYLDTPGLAEPYDWDDAWSSVDDSTWDDSFSVVSTEGFY